MTTSHADLVKIIKSELLKICNPGIPDSNLMDSMKLHELINDSLDLLDFGMQLENATGKEIKLDQLNKNMTIHDLAFMLTNQANSQSR